MAKREIVQLAKVLGEDSPVGGWYMSEKLDGIRAVWDGVGARTVVFGGEHLNYGKRAGECTVTGLWTRRGKVIEAPAWWISRWCIPGMCLDGEIWGHGLELRHILGSARRTVNIDNSLWERLEYRVFDMPGRSFFVGRPWAVEFDGLVGSWCFSSYGEVLGELRRCGASVLPQVQLPMGSSEARRRAWKEAGIVKAGGGEGVMLRHPSELWVPHRVGHLLKVKPVERETGVLVDWTLGKGKYSGRVGAYLVRMDDSGTVVTCSGMTDSEREVGFVVDRIGRRVVVEYETRSGLGGYLKPRFRGWLD